MKKGLIFFLILVVLISIFTVSALDSLNYDDVYSCNIDSDCIVIENRNCQSCDCKDAINKDYIEYYEEINSERECPVIDCAPCLDYEATNSTCESNICKVVIPEDMYVDSGFIDPLEFYEDDDFYISSGLISIILVGLFGLFLFIGLIVGIVLLIYFLVRRSRNPLT